MTHNTGTASAEAALLACDPDIRILHRVSALADFPLAEPVTGPIRRCAIVDTETTGTDPMTDEIIDVAVVIVEVDTAGQIVGIASAGQALRNPGFPIPEAITRLTGITDEDVEGKAIDLDRLGRLLAGADVRIAHNAAFDLAFLQNLMPVLDGAAWACSARDVDWTEAGFEGARLGHLLMQAGWFNTAAHRAMADVISLLHILAHRLPDGRTMLGILLANAKQATLRIEANGAPFDKRSILKARGYRWDPAAKVWWTEIAEHEETSETLWLHREVMPWGPTPRTRRLTWHERHR